MSEFLADMELYQWLAIGGAALALLALVLYFLPVKAVKIPAVLVGIVGGLLAGVSAGVFLMAAFGYSTTKPGEDAGKTAGPGGGAPPGMAGGKGGMPFPPGGPGGKGGMPFPPGGKGGMPFPPGGKGGAPADPSQQLAGLLTRMNRLIEKPLRVELTEDQRKEVYEQIKDIDKDTKLSDT